MTPILKYNKQSDRDQKGFTLIEIMIAITVFAIGLLAINVMQTTSIKGNSAASSTTLRTNDASERIEILMADDYNGTITTPANPPSLYNNTITQTVVEDSPILNVATVTIQVDDNATGASTTFTYIKSDME